MFGDEKVTAWFNWRRIYHKTNQFENIREAIQKNEAFKDWFL